MANENRRQLMKAATVGLLALAEASAARAAPAAADRASQSIRRIVTGDDGKGRSAFLLDGPSPHVHQRPQEGVTVIDLWETRSVPVDNGPASDMLDHPLSLQPPRNGSLFRIVEFQPDAIHEGGLVKQPTQVDDGSGIVAALRNGAKNRPLGFHTTNTIDYCILVSGEIYALLDEGERLMKAGDVLIQRGTIHKWSNRSQQPARLAIVMIDSLPLKDNSPA